MKTLEDRIKIEYYRLSSKWDVEPSYLHVHPSFVKKMRMKYCNGLRHYIDEEENTYRYMGMIIKRSLDINEDEFILSFNKYQL